MNFEKSLLLVIPTVFEKRDGRIHFDLDFSNNLEAYLKEFETVTVACPLAPDPSGFPGTRLPDDIHGGDRIRTIVLPTPYREDAYLFNRRSVSKLLAGEIKKSRYILISPHAFFDWSTLAAEICIRNDRKYNMESDWNWPKTTKYIWSQMPFGLNKLRKWLWFYYHLPKYMHCLKKSDLSLVQGEDVYNDYRAIAPNAHSVLNIQITENDRISQERLHAKLEDIKQGRPLRLVYAGRAIEMKGPIHWLESLLQARELGGEFEAVWFGSGPMVSDMEAFIARHQLHDKCRLMGMADRSVVFDAMRSADAFLFCHMGKESPRCLMEALASGAPLVGFGSDYSRSLVRDQGGGIFVEPNDSTALASVIVGLGRDVDKLRNLVACAARSGRLLDRDTAIQNRIDLMKKFL